MMFVALMASACVVDDEGEWVEADADDGKADGSTRPAPNGEYDVKGAYYAGYSISESIDGGTFQVVASSGVSGDGYQSWYSDYPRVKVTPNADDSIKVSLNGHSGVLWPGVNFYAGIYTGQLGTVENGVRVNYLSAARWNTATKVVDRISIDYRSQSTTTATSKRWVENPRREVTVTTKTVRWRVFETGRTPGFHR